MRGRITDGSDSGRWRSRFLRPVGRRLRLTRSKLHRSEAGKRPDQPINGKELEALGQAKLGRASLVLGATRATVRARCALLHRGAILHRRCSGSPAVLTRISMRQGTLLTRKLCDCRPGRQNRRKSDSDRNECDEYSAKREQGLNPPAVKIDVRPRVVNANYRVRQLQTNQVRVPLRSGRLPSG
jgi:hypothetical protein